MNYYMKGICFYQLNSTNFAGKGFELVPLKNEGINLFSKHFKLHFLFMFSTVTKLKYWHFLNGYIISASISLSQAQYYYDYAFGQAGIDVKYDKVRKRQMNCRKQLYLDVHTFKIILKLL